MVFNSAGGCLVIFDDVGWILMILHDFLKCWIQILKGFHGHSSWDMHVLCNPLLYNLIYELYDEWKVLCAGNGIWLRFPLSLSIFEVHQLTNDLAVAAIDGKFGDPFELWQQFFLIGTRPSKNKVVPSLLHPHFNRFKTLLPILCMYILMTLCLSVEPQNLGQIHNHHLAN